MAIDPIWQRCQDRPAIRGDPALALVTGGTRRNHQVLHQERLVALEARSFRDRDLHHLILDANTRCHLAAEPPLPLLSGPGRLCRFVHAARFDSWPALQAFQTGDLFA